MGQIPPEESVQLTVPEVFLEAQSRVLCVDHSLMKVKAHSSLCCVSADCDISCWTQGGSSGSEGLKDCDHRTGQTGFAGPEKARKQNKSQEV